MSRPDGYADVVFDRFTALYGSQKLAAMWAGAELRKVKATWSEALAGFAPESVGAALRACEGTASGWPPGLPEFVELCRQASLARERQRPVPRALVDARPADREQARRSLQRIGDAFAAPRGDPLGWARSPKSAQAVHLLARSAPGDPRLAEILARHRAEGGARCCSPEAAAAIRALGAPAGGDPGHGQLVDAPRAVSEEAWA